MEIGDLFFLAFAVLQVMDSKGALSRLTNPPFSRFPLMLLLRQDRN